MRCPKDTFPRNGTCLSAQEWADLTQQHGQQLDAVRRARLRADPWLAGFEPLPLECALYARKIGAESLAHLAAVAFSCDGLGFGWECLALQDFPAFVFVQ